MDDHLTVRELDASDASAAVAVINVVARTDREHKYAHQPSKSRASIA